MIRIKDYIIDSDEYQYTVYSVKVCQDKESKNYGKEYQTARGYYSSLSGALEGVLRSYQRKIVKENDLTLEKAIKEFKTLQEEFKALLDKYEAIGEKND
jgi:hypothetical protein